MKTVYEDFVKGISAVWGAVNSFEFLGALLGFIFLFSVIFGFRADYIHGNAVKAECRAKGMSAKNRECVVMLTEKEFNAFIDRN